MLVSRNVLAQTKKKVKRKEHEKLTIKNWKIVHDKFKKKTCKSSFHVALCYREAAVDMRVRNAFWRCSFWGWLQSLTDFCLISQKLHDSDTEFYTDDGKFAVFLVFKE